MDFGLLEDWKHVSTERIYTLLNQATLAEKYLGINQTATFHFR